MVEKEIVERGKRNSLILRYVQGGVKWFLKTIK